MAWGCLDCSRFFSLSAFIFETVKDRKFYRVVGASRESKRCSPLLFYLLARPASPVGVVAMVADQKFVLVRGVV